MSACGVYNRRRPEPEYPPPDVLSLHKVRAQALRPNEVFTSHGSATPHYRPVLMR